MTLLERDPSPEELKETKTNWIKCAVGITSEFEWKDYCPTVFRNIQKIQGIDYTEYMLAVCGENILRQVATPGNFCNNSQLSTLLSSDDQFVMKVLRKSEVKVILRMLPNYFRHIQIYRSTLLCKLYGLHAVKPYGGGKVYFVVMSNQMKSDLQMNFCYDLKGSVKGRNGNKIVVDDGAIQKDANFNFCFYVDTSVRRRLLRQIKFDCEFLEAHGIMDYSLLLGIHIETRNEGNDGSTSNRRSPISARSSISSKRDISSDTSSEIHETETIFSCTASLSDNLGYKFGIQMPAHAIRTLNDAGSISSLRRVTANQHLSVLMNFAVVDFFQDYNMWKRIENVCKSLPFDSRSSSAANPKAYSSRFQEFLGRIFQGEDSMASHLVHGFKQ